MTVVSPLIDRRTGIGGSEVAAVLGLDPRRSPYDVWLQKRGLIDDEFIPNDRMLAGKHLQVGIANWYAERMHRRIRWCDDIRRSRVRDWQIWTPDFICVDDPIGGDAKNVAWDQAHMWGESGTDVVPDRVACQCHWYMNASNEFLQWDVAALLDGNDLRVYSIPRDLETEELIVERVERFWRDCVLGDREPDISDTAVSDSYLRSRFPRANLSLREPSEAELELLREYASTRAGRIALKKAEGDLLAKLKLSLGDDQGFKIDFGKFTYKNCKDSVETDWKSLALPLVGKLPDEERTVLMDIHTRPVPGERRIYAKFKGEEADGSSN